MTSSPDRPFATLTDQQLEGRERWLRDQQAKLCNPRTTADKKLVGIIQRDLSVISEEWMLRAEQAQ